MNQEHFKEIERVFRICHESPAIRAYACSGKSFDVCEYPSCQNRRSLLEQLKPKRFSEAIRQMLPSSIIT